MKIIILLSLCYLIGSIPFGIVWARLLGAGNLQNQGSGNIGATNAFRVGGKMLGLLTLVSDLGKGMLAVFLAQSSGLAEAWQAYAILFAVFGHVFPIWLYGKGGKGVATALGGLLILAPTTAVIAICLWLLTFYFSKAASLASLAAASFSGIYFYINYDDYFPIIAAVFLIIYKHKNNIERLLAGKEFRFHK
jgi:glycerol-3-phosphate acyltransferase PlsY